MTREEHIENLKAIASDMPSDKCPDWIESLMAGVKALEQEPCIDAISRQAAIVALDDRMSSLENVDMQIAMGFAKGIIHGLPPVTPAEKPNKRNKSEARRWKRRYLDLKQRIFKLEERTKWIPVSERLPEKSEYGKVLVTYIPSGGTLWTTVIIAHYSDLMGIAKPSFHIGEVGKESFLNITEQVIAWMPLPEPYKASLTGAESEDKE